MVEDIVWNLGRFRRLQNYPIYFFSVITLLYVLMEMQKIDLIFLIESDFKNEVSK